MNRTVLPAPPDPRRYANVSAWQDATYDWMRRTKSLIETDSSANIVPLAPFVVDSYTLTSTITGTDATSNFVATLVTAMQKRGITSPSGGV